MTSSRNWGIDFISLRPLPPGVGSRFLQGTFHNIHLHHLFCEQSLSACDAAGVLGHDNSPAGSAIYCLARRWFGHRRVNPNSRTTSPTSSLVLKRSPANR